MKWRKQHIEAPPTREEAPETDVTVSSETERALAAARAAAVQLHEIRRKVPLITQTSEELSRLNRRNGFSGLIRKALESGS